MIEIEPVIYHLNEMKKVKISSYSTINSPYSLALLRALKCAHTLIKMAVDVALERFT